jgi:hypothetical protein
MNNEDIKRHLRTLIEDGERVKDTKYELFHGGPTYVDREMSRQWATNSVALIRSAFNNTSEHYAAASRFAAECHIHANATQLLAVLRAAAVAWDSGYVFEIKKLAEAAVESSLIEQAQELLAKNFYHPAAALAGAVLERHLRTLCAKYGVAEKTPEGKPKSMGGINDELHSKNAYSGVTHKHVTHLAGIRNNAAHFNSPIDKDDAKALVRDTIALCSKLE